MNNRANVDIPAVLKFEVHLDLHKKLLKDLWDLEASIDSADQRLHTSLSQVRLLIANEQAYVHYFERQVGVEK